MTIHLIASSRPEILGLQANWLSASDVLVFLGEGVYAMRHFADSAMQCRIYAIAEDWHLRLADTKAPVGELIDYSRLVELTLTHTPVASWYD